MATIAATRLAEALARIKAVLGPKGWTAEPAEMAPYLADERRLWQGRAALVCLPASTKEVAAIVQIGAEARLPIVPQGGNTGMCGGAVPQSPDTVLVNLRRMNRIRALDRLNDAITVEAGCVLADIQNAAEDADRLFPLSLGAEGSCQIGGNLSTNAGGVNVLRYGMTRELVLGLEVVLPDGRVWDGLGALRKDNTGYDLKHLFLGAEGTLGVITAAVLKLFARPRTVETALIGIRDPAAALELLARARADSGDTVVAFELVPRACFDFVLRHIPGAVDPLAARHDWYVLMEWAGGDLGGALRERMEASLGEAAEAGLLRDATIAASDEQRNALWRLRDSITESQKPEGASIKHDVAVPVSRVPEFISRATAAVEREVPGVRVLAFGHVGDGNIHFNLSQPAGGAQDQAARTAFTARTHDINAIVHTITAELGGSISAEHGIGLLKRAELPHYKSAIGLDLMRTLKRAFDPHGIMNPGKVL
jgi:FAD/FMN-containing dehydrogenase